MMVHLSPRRPGDVEKRFTVESQLRQHCLNCQLLKDRDAKPLRARWTCGCITLPSCLP
jgi:hypothetical protein